MYTQNNKYVHKNDRVTRCYSEPFKLKILAELSTGKYTKNQLGKLCGINLTTINEWIKKYERKSGLKSPCNFLISSFNLATKKVVRFLVFYTIHK